ncbi:fla cluster protein FlaD1 [Haloferax mediterranei ATCC 33500]|uniref:Fla cluster protein flaD n=1 Tax=Haloferax mediterranei (strain ATCC 33500 / DSM 1411 / JCM 8866 / NBRC 14739 / NCIMB 2177 / R-4) TaxID=523841 RepID=I3R3W6_HALMT|nr:FlaD/FlaE family flagellar protein [Haloferax mediterranei]AFK18926.1 fla cluster protein flaD [Haloferax mediterranei ATCC 33500]AHZ21711.1 fla cluster protein FlaD1 [Haloferax mediterranei ATCC 33500]EMA03215.1 fla cluster protein flaD [Haloferax mediterranei ATCC 33500]MDX5989019.1 FlaD/FlaE family flagellar protein [Haloferax mediterranei ATCC 33500]QCQ75412.1 fla cluster protein FlaD1 [Haloferax mediterranei ATCC 33500]
MYLDPDEYDPDELRRIARDTTRPRRNGDSRFDDRSPFRFDNPLFDRNRQEASEALRSSQLEHLLIHQSRGEEDGVEKPYLRSLPDKYGAERVVFDWLEFLVLKGGFKRAMDALQYYQTVNWLTEDVEQTLRDYLLGFSAEVDEPTELDVDDHLLSLVYVARLASMV